MIGKLMYVQNWTDLCIKGLTELAATHKGPWSDPLTIPYAELVEKNLCDAKDASVPSSPVNAEKAPKTNFSTKPSRNGHRKRVPISKPLTKQKKIAGKHTRK